MESGTKVTFAGVLFMASVSRSKKVDIALHSVTPSQRGVKSDLDGWCLAYESGCNVALRFFLDVSSEFKGRV